MAQSRTVNGTGSIVSIKRIVDGKAQIVGWRAIDSWTTQDGRLKRKYMRAPTQRAARQRLREAQQQRANGLDEKANITTVAAFLTDWLKTYKTQVRHGTWLNRESQVRMHIIPTIGRIPLAKLKKSDVVAMMATVTEQSSARHAGTVRTTLRRALMDAMGDDLVARNVASLAKPPRVDEREMLALDPHEARAFIEATRDQPLGTYIALLINTGLRRGEALALRWDAVHPEGATPWVDIKHSMSRSAAGTYGVGRTKTGKARQVTLSAGAVAVLRRQATAQKEQRLAAGPAWQDTGFVFTRADGTPMSPEVVSQLFTRLVRSLPMKQIRLHDLRHTYASLAFAAGIDVKIISTSLGHKNIGITYNTYTHLIPTQSQVLADAMDRVLGYQA
jgi:integrase